MGDEVYVHYFGCPNTYNSWPSQYAVSAERRGSLFAPVYLGLATLPRDPFAYAEGPGSITTQALEIGDDGLWLNADGDGVVIVAAQESGKGSVSGRLTPEKRQTVYRKVKWDGPVQNRCRLKITLDAGSRLYSIQL